MKYNNDAVITDGSMAGDLTSATVPVEYNWGVGFQITWSGSSPVGVIYAEASCDDLRGTASSATNWTELSGTTLNVSGNTGSLVMQLVDLSVSAVRLIYDRSSGSGTMQVRAITKGW